MRANNLVKNGSERANCRTTTFSWFISCNISLTFAKIIAFLFSTISMAYSVLAKWYSIITIKFMCDILWNFNHFHSFLFKIFPNGIVDFADLHCVTISSCLLLVHKATSAEPCVYPLGFLLDIQNGNYSTQISVSLTNCQPVLGTGVEPVSWDWNSRPMVCLFV